MKKLSTNLPILKESIIMKKLSHKFTAVVVTLLVGLSTLVVGTSANASTIQSSPVSITFVAEHPHCESDTNSYSEVVDPEKERLISEIKKITKEAVAEHPHCESDTNSYSEVVDPEKERLISEIKKITKERESFYSGVNIFIVVFLIVLIVVFIIV